MLHLHHFLLPCIWTDQDKYINKAHISVCVGGEVIHPLDVKGRVKNRIYINEIYKAFKFKVLVQITIQKTFSYTFFMTTSYTKLITWHFAKFQDFQDKVPYLRTYFKIFRTWTTTETKKMILLYPLRDLTRYILILV